MRQRGRFLPSFSLLKSSIRNLDRLLLGNRALAWPFARPRVGARPLPTDRQVASMPHPPPAPDFHQALDVHRDLLAEITFHSSLFLDHPADLPDVFLGQILDTDVRTDAGLGQDVVRALPPDAVDVGQPDLDPLGAGKVNACYTSHFNSPLSLTLLVFLVRADHPDDAASADNLALVAHALDRCSNFHRCSLTRGRSYNFATILPRVRSRGDSSNLTRSPT